MVAEPGRLGGAFELNGEEGGWEDLIFWLQNQAFRQELSGRSEAERAAARAMAKLVGDIETMPDEEASTFRLDQLVPGTDGQPKDAVAARGAGLLFTVLADVARGTAAEILRARRDLDGVAVLKEYFKRYSKGTGVAAFTSVFQHRWR